MSNETKTELPELSATEFKTLQQELRDRDVNWMEALLTQIKADKKVKQKFKTDISTRKLYNVFNGIVKNRSWQVLVYNQATALKNSLSGELKLSEESESSN